MKPIKLLLFLLVSASPLAFASVGKKPAPRTADPNNPLLFQNEITYPQGVPGQKLFDRAQEAYNKGQFEQTVQLLNELHSQHGTLGDSQSLLERAQMGAERMKKRQPTQID